MFFKNSFTSAEEHEYPVFSIVPLTLATVEIPTPHVSNASVHTVVLAMQDGVQVLANGVHDAVPFTFLRRVLEIHLEIVGHSGFER